MKKKTIEKILNNKFDSFVKTITDKKIKKLVEKGTIITGGCIASMFLQEDVNDYDLYFKDLETAKAVAEYYVDVFKKNKKDRNVNNKCKSMMVVVEDGRVRVMIKSSGVESETTENKDYAYFEQLDPGNPQQDEFINNALEFEKDRNTSKESEYKPIFLTSNAITLSNDVQLILRFYGDPDKIHQNYDFIHCTNYWTSWNRKVVTRTEALESLLAKELKYTGSLYPICSLIRIRKFLKRGWSITAGEIFKMAWQVSKLNLDDPKCLEDQMIGVDVAYFYELIQCLNKARKDGKDINTTYVMQLIDEIF